MSKPPDTDLLQAAIGGSRLPRTFDREGRVRLIALAAKGLLASGTAEGLFVVGALMAWLEQGGDLEREYFKVKAKAGSHHTPKYVWQSLPENGSSGGANGTQDIDMLQFSFMEKG